MENEVVAVIDNASVGDLSTDVLANVFRFLGPKEIMQKRRVSKKWTEAVKMTIVPLTDFRVDSVENYNAMRVMTRAMPNLQQITLTTLGRGHYYVDGEDPEGLALISNFSKLQILEIRTYAGLNGRYPALFNFPLLQKLSIRSCKYLKWDLDMLAGFPVLKELDCYDNRCLTGNINSLRVLKDTLEKVNIDRCPNVEGNFMDLADFPHLKELKLDDTAVTGDIRDIGENDFSFLEQLKLPRGVYGANCCELQRISDGPEFIRSVYLFGKKRPTLKMEGWRKRVYGFLSKDSPDWYESAENDRNTPPFYIVFVEAGSRIGYRWETSIGYRWGTNFGKPCEVNWLDPEPSRESGDYGKYIEELQKIEKERQDPFYKGFHQPPTEEEYHRLLEEYDLLPNTA